MSRVVPVRVDSHLRVDANLLGYELADKIIDDLIVENPDYFEAKAKGVWGLDAIPESFHLVELDGDTLVMARGYALQLKLLLREHGIGVWWQDKTVWRRGKPMGFEEFHYRPQQPAAVRKIKHHRQGIYKAPTGSGKTVTAVGLIWDLLPEKSIILVDRINLVDQWVNRIAEHAGIPKDEIGTIGEGKWTEGRITVATVQSLHRHRKRLQDEGWFDQWSVMCLDECHHVTAETLIELVQMFPARYRFGMSATPDKTGVFEIALNVLGEVFYETTHEELRELGILVEPEVKVVPTPFSFTYWGDHKADKKGNCDKPGCKNRQPFHRHRNNYADLKSKLVNDETRNRLILDNIAYYYQIGEVQLVITDQTSQIEALIQEWDAGHGHFVPPEHVHILTGKQKRKKREQIITEVETMTAPHIIFSTIAGEALDIAKISAVHLVFPTRNPRKTEQNVGRATRMYEAKSDPVILDYVDNNVPVLVGQFRSRRWKCYEPLGFKVSADELEDQPKRKKGLTSLGGG